MGQLFICTFTKENFKILICAEDICEANKLARDYATDSHFEDDFEVEVAGKIDDIHFDCDYIVC